MSEKGEIQKCVKFFLIWSERCYSGQNDGVIKPQNVGVIVNPCTKLVLYSLKMTLKTY